MRFAHPNARFLVFILAVSSFAAFFVPRTYALNVGDIDARLGLFWIGNGYTVDASGNPVQKSDVSPLAGGAGIDLGFHLSPSLTLRPAIDLFGIEYAMTTSGKVVPTQIESADALLMLNVLISAPLTMTFPIADKLQLSAGVSPSVLLRIPTIGYGSPDRAAITAYMYQSARFFYPEAQIGLNYLFTPRVQFGLMLRTLFPIFHFWDGEQVPFWDQMIASGTFFLRFTL